MRIIIFGGAGFLGKKLALALLKKGTLSPNGGPQREITRLVLFDKVKPSGLYTDSRLELIEGDICDKATIENLLAQPTDVIFHLAAIVSGEAEKNFDLGMAVNLLATLQMLDVCRKSGTAPVFVFAGTCGVFAGDLTDEITDITASTPQSSYGTQKAIGDLLVNDYSRRGFVDGRVIRLPTIAIRPGKPNAATSTFISSIIREPLQGKRAVCPVPEDVRAWILSPRRVTENFILAAEMEAAVLGKNRIINLPGITVSIKELVSTLEDIAGKEATALIDWEPDAFIQSIVLTWPEDFVTERADKLGFKRDNSVKEMIEAFIEDELGGKTR